MVRKVTITFCLAQAVMIQTFAQDTGDRKVYVELEPLQFVSNGFSVVGHYAVSDRVQVGVNVFASTLSEGFNNLAFDFNEAIDLEATQELGINVSVRYFLSKAHEGWVVSLPIGYETWELEDLNTGFSVDYDFWYLSPRVGYLWYPFRRKRFYVLGEVVGIVPVTGSTVLLEDLPIEINPFIPLPGLGVGFRF